MQSGEQKWTRPRDAAANPPGERSSRARSRSDRWQKQRGKTPSLAATRGHTTALGHLGCHKDRVMEPCFGRRARRAAHVSDPRRSILRSGGGGRTLSGDVEPRCSLEHAGPPKQPSRTPGEPVRRAGGRTPGRGRTRGGCGSEENFKNFLLPPYSQATAAFHDGVKRVERRIYGAWELP